LLLLLWLLLLLLSFVVRMTLLVRSCTCSSTCVKSVFLLRKSWKSLPKCAQLEHAFQCVC